MLIDFKDEDNTLSKDESQRFFDTIMEDEKDVFISKKDFDALIKQPLVILADEPTGNLDPNISDEILDILEIATSGGASVLMSTHNFPLIQPRKKRFIELNEGRIVD